MVVRQVELTAWTWIGAGSAGPLDVEEVETKIVGRTGDSRHRLLTVLVAETRFGPAGYSDARLE